MHDTRHRQVHVRVRRLVRSDRLSFFTYSGSGRCHDSPNRLDVHDGGQSCTKAMLVMLFFMHVKYEANWKYVLTIPAGCMAIFLDLCSDSRRRHAQPLGFARSV